MPAYSYKEQFVPFLLDESKDHTVRKERAGRSRHAGPGETIYHYFGMRTKWCRKIGESICTEVRKIRIAPEGIHWHVTGLEGQSKFIALTKEESDVFAWSDGFRPEGTTSEDTRGAFTLMLQFWKETHELPFYGVSIYWKDFKATTK